MSLQFWLVLAGAAALHFVWFSVRAPRYGRFVDAGPWAGFKAAGENLRLHNPFSWAVCVRTRMAFLKRTVCRVHGAQHDTLGLVTWADLENPWKQDRIAREAFPVPRFLFWLGAVKNYAWCVLFVWLAEKLWFRLMDALWVLTT